MTLKISKTQNTANTIKVSFKARPGQKVLVKNYRKKGEPAELGTVYNTSINIGTDLTYRVRYDIILDRKRTGRHEGAGLWLYVGEERIVEVYTYIPNQKQQFV